MKSVPARATHPAFLQGTMKGTTWCRPCFEYENPIEKEESSDDLQELSLHHAQLITRFLGE